MPDEESMPEEPQARRQRQQKLVGNAMDRWSSKRNPKQTSFSEPIGVNLEGGCECPRNGFGFKTGCPHLGRARKVRDWRLVK